MSTSVDTSRVHPCGHTDCMRGDLLIVNGSRNSARQMSLMVHPGPRPAFPEGKRRCSCLSLAGEHIHLMRQKTEQLLSATVTQESKGPARKLS